MLSLKMAVFVLAFPAYATCSERANLCFTAHAKTSLQCTHPLKDGEVLVFLLLFSHHVSV